MRRRRIFYACASLAILAGCGSLGPTTDTGPPQLVIVSPTTGEMVGHQVLIEAQAIDDIGIDNVRFLVDGAEIAKLLTAPYRFTWNNTLQSGSTHTIRAEARDFSQNLTVQEVSVTISTAHGAP